MTREIKFRAWEKNLKEMISVDDIQFHHPNEIEIDGIRMKPKEVQPTLINTKSAWRTLDEVVLMQYTGLKDKNGKEIYEGDVVMIEDYYHDYQDGIAINSIPDNRIEAVEWDNEHGMWATKTDSLCEQRDLVEVIGNIYENPELLK